VELRQLRYFIAVAEELNFTKAAYKLHISQPPLSRQIRQLEEEFGVQLFARDRTKVELTDPGKTFLREAHAVVNQANWAAQVLERSKSGHYGALRIAIASGLSGVIRRVLKSFAKRYPRVDVQCQDVLSGLQNEALRVRRVDVGFLRPPVASAHLESEPLFRERILVYIAETHPLAKRRKIQLQQVASEPLLLYDRDSSTGVYDKVLDLYRRAGITPKVIHVGMTPYQEAGALLVARRKGIYLGVGAVLSHPLQGSGLKAIPIDERDATIEVHMAWRKNEPSTVVHAFLDTTRRVLGISARSLKTAHS